MYFIVLNTSCCEPCGRSVLLLCISPGTRGSSKVTQSFQCSVFSSLMCSISALSTAGSKYSWGRGFACVLCHMELNALTQPGSQSASDLSLRPLGLMPYSWTWWSSSFYYQLSCSFGEESPWLLMRLETGDCWCGCTQTPSAWRNGAGLLCSCGRATPTEVCGAGGFPRITALVGVDAGAGELCIVTVACPPEVLGICVLYPRSWGERDNLLKTSLLNQPLTGDSSWILWLQWIYTWGGINL